VIPGPAPDPKAVLPAMRRAGGAPMSLAKVWGDGSSVSRNREALIDVTPEPGLAEQRAALELEAVANNLRLFAETLPDPAADLWKRLG
jgi:hypothetical protein